MPAENQIPEESSFSITDFMALFHGLLEKSWVIVLCVIAAAFLTYSYIVRAPIVYESKAVVEVEQQDSKVVNIEKVDQQDLRMYDVPKTIEQSLQSRSLFERVFDKLALNANNLPDLKLKIIPKISLGDKKEPTRESLVERLQGLVRIQLRRGTRLIDISTEHTDPVLAQKITNTLIDEYMKLNVEQTVASSSAANDFLKEQAVQLKKTLRESEEKLQKYREDKKTVSLDEKQNIVLERAREIDRQHAAAQEKVRNLEPDSRLVDRLGTNIQALLAIKGISEDQTVIETLRSLSESQSEIASLKERYKEQHPKMIAAQSKMKEWQTALDKAVLNSRDRVKATYENAKLSEEAFKKAADAQKDELLILAKLKGDYDVLARDVETNRKIYDNIIQRMQETSITKELNIPSKLKISQAAYTPQSPSKPQKKRMWAMGLAAGFAFGIMLAMGLNALDSSLKTVDQAELYLERPVLGAIPNLKGKLAGADQLVMVANSNSPAAEAFRTLRTSLSFLGRDEDRRVFLFTSSIPAEGKTFCSLNFSASLAQQGLKTLLIDADLRRPAVEKALLQAPERLPGVSEYLTGKKGIKEVCHKTGTDGLMVCPAGTTAPNPAELLSTPAFGELIKDALQHFDRVVIDSAPIHAVSDTLLLVRHTQTVCLVIHSRRTPRRAVGRSVHLLHNAQAPLAGIIMNRLPRGSGRSYYYDSYYSYSYYGKYAEKGVYGSKS